DLVQYDVIRPDGDACGEGFICPAPAHLLVNLGSVDLSNPNELAEDHFLLDARAGWAPISDDGQPATIDILGSHGSQQATLMFGQIGSPVPGAGPPGPDDHLMIHMDLGDDDDSGDVSYGTGIYVPVQLDGDLGSGNDTFAATFMPDSGAAQGSNT